MALVGSDLGVEAVGSALVEVESGWRPSSEGIALVAGFFVALLTNITLRLVERWGEGRRMLLEIEKVVADCLAEERLKNQKALAEFLASPGGPAPTLTVAGHESLLGDKGAMAYLSIGERARYFRGVETLYGEIRKFNTLATRLADEPGVRPQVEAGAESLAKQLSGS